MKRSISRRLLEWKESIGRKPLLILGARQIGKTHSLKELGRSFDNYHLINFEENKLAKLAFAGNLNPKEILTNLELNLKIKIKPNDLIILDEIQECPEAITSLKYFCEGMSSQAIAAAGSLLGVRVSEASFPVGKIEILHMQPMSFEEFLFARDPQLHQIFLDTKIQTQLNNLVHESLWELFKEYLIVGGMPKAVDEFINYIDDKAKAFQKASKEQEQILKTYYLDIGKHCGKENSMHIQRIFENIPEQLARNQNNKSNRYLFKGVIPKKDRYKDLVGIIDWLEAAGLIHRVAILDHIERPLPAYSKENLFKLYLFDIGLLRALSRLDYREILRYDFGTYKGYLVENFVLQELIYASHGERKFFSWSQNTAEIEFLLETEDEVIPVEVKSGLNVKSKSLYSFAKRYSPSQLILLSGQNHHHNPPLLKIPLYLSARILSGPETCEVTFRSL